MWISVMDEAGWGCIGLGRPFCWWRVGTYRLRGLYKCYSPPPSPPPRLCPCGPSHLLFKNLTDGLAAAVMLVISSFRRERQDQDHESEVNLGPCLKTKTNEVKEASRCARTLFLDKGVGKAASFTGPGQYLAEDALPDAWVAAIFLSLYVFPL